MKFLLFKYSKHYFSILMNDVKRVEKIKKSRKSPYSEEKFKIILKNKNELFASEILGDYEYKHEIVKVNKLLKLLIKNYINGFLIINNQIFILLKSNHRYRRE